MSSKEKKIICIACPQGCEIAVKEENGNLILSGYTCKKGEEYALEEYKAPKRILTTTIRVENGLLPLCPVRTTFPIPKDMLFLAMEQISKYKVKAPLIMGQILLENILETGVNIVASRDLREK